jgi:transaldolase
MPQDGGDADNVLAEFAHDGIEEEELAAQLQREGAESFTKSWRDLMDVLASKCATLGSAPKKTAGRA